MSGSKPESLEMKKAVGSAVGEAEQLLVLRGVTRVMQAAEDRERCDGGGGAATLAAELGELGALVGFGVEENAACGVKEQRGLHEPAPVFEGGGFRAAAVLIKVELAGELRGFLRAGDEARFRLPEPGFGKRFHVFGRVPHALTYNQIAVGRLISVCALGFSVCGAAVPCPRFRASVPAARSAVPARGKEGRGKPRP